MKNKRMQQQQRFLEKIEIEQNWMLHLFLLDTLIRSMNKSDFETMRHQNLFIISIMTHW